MIRENTACGKILNANSKQHTTGEQFVHLMANPPFFLASLHRRMFPTLRCSFSGIDQIQMHGDCRLLVMTDIVPCDNKRYRYAYHRSSWLVAGKADPPSPSRLYLHPDAPYSMEQLRKQVISFEKVKLTNNEMDKSGHVSRPVPSFPHC